MIEQVSLDKKFAFGIKRTCLSCGVNFYDLDKHPSECPNCGAVYELHVSSRVRRGAKDFLEQETDFEVPFELDDGFVADEAVAETGGLVEDDPFGDLNLDNDSE